MYTHSFRDRAGVVHIVAMPTSRTPYAACGTIYFDLDKSDRAFHFVPGVATCLRCWARELLEWTWEANTSTPQKGL